VTPRAVIDAFVAQAMKADPILADLKNDGEFNDFKPVAPGHAHADSVRIRRPGRDVPSTPERCWREWP
jgi:hypothetical protein